VGLVATGEQPGNEDSDAPGASPPLPPPFPSKDDEEVRRIALGNAVLAVNGLERGLRTEGREEEAIATGAASAALDAARRLVDDTAVQRSNLEKKRVAVKRTRAVAACDAAALVCVTHLTELGLAQEASKVERQRAALLHPRQGFIQATLIEQAARSIQHLAETPSPRDWLPEKAREANRVEFDHQFTARKWYNETDMEIPFTEETMNRLKKAI